MTLLKLKQKKGVALTGKATPKTHTNADYQRSRRCSLGKYILSPGFTPKASYHMSM